MSEWITTPIEPPSAPGRARRERTARGLVPHRLPAWVREQFPDEYLARVEAQPSGVRLAFRTRATVIELDVLRHQDRVRGPAGTRAGPLRPAHRWSADRPAERSGRQRLPDRHGGPVGRHPARSGRHGSLHRPAGAAKKPVEIRLPQTELTELIALRTDAPCGPSAARGPGCLAAPRQLDQPRLQRRRPHRAPGRPSPRRRAGVELINLGFSGNALLDPFVARVMRDTPADLHQPEDRHQPGECRPDAAAGLRPGRARLPRHHPRRPSRPRPCSLVSPLLCPIQEAHPGPARSMRFDGDEVRFFTTADRWTAPAAG